VTASRSGQCVLQVNGDILHGKIAGLDVNEQSVREIDCTQQRCFGDAGRANGTSLLHARL
jgi:hypothetical protein